MTEKRFTMDNPNDWGFPITDNVTGKVYNCASNILMKELCVVVNTIVEENEQLKKELQKYDGWCNSVKRENIDKVLKMSIFEIVEAFEYYDKKIEDYEKVLNGDVE